MAKYRIIGFISVLLILTGNSYAQTNNPDILSIGEIFWALPATECDGDNFCEVRISAEGTIYGWDNLNRKLYVSPINETVYHTYDLSHLAYDPQTRSGYLGFHTDFISFETEGYIVFYSSIGGYSNFLIRYDLHSGDVQEYEFPEGYRLFHCNRNMGVKQRTLRLIYPIGLNGHFMACTDSPQHNPIFHIINLNTLSIEQSIDIDESIFDVVQPSWVIVGGLDNKVYVWSYNPENVIPNIPLSDEQNEEIILVYDVDRETWLYELVPLETPLEMLAVLPTSEILYHSLFDDSLLFLGAASNGNVFFRIGEDYSDVTIMNINNYPISNMP